MLFKEKLGRQSCRFVVVAPLPFYGADRESGNKAVQKQVV